jgi:hypothetical protein
VTAPTCVILAEIDRYFDPEVVAPLTTGAGFGKIGWTANLRPATRHKELPMTKNALTIMLLTLILTVSPGVNGFADDSGWMPLFDGKTLDGWKVNGGTASYKVEDGVIVGTTVDVSPNTFLCKGDYKDFVLELEVKCDPRLNSGVQVRSHVYEKDDADPANRKSAGVVYGPQCEIASKETGTAGRFYDEGRRGKWLAEIRPEAKDSFKDDDWNRYRIIVQGNHYQWPDTELEVGRFAIATFQFGQENRPFFLGSRFSHNLAAVQRLTLARWYSGRAIGQ